MGGIWWMYGIGLKGAAAEWAQVEGRTVIQEVELLHEAGVLDDRPTFTAADDVGRGLGSAAGAARRRGLDAGRRRRRPSSVRRRHRPACSSKRTTLSAPASTKSPPCTRSAARRTPSCSAIEALDFDRLLAPPVLHAGRGGPVRRAARPSRAGPRSRPKSTPACSASTCTWSATSARCVSRRPTSASVPRSCSSPCAGLLHRRDRFVAENLTRKALAAA